MKCPTPKLVPEMTKVMAMAVKGWILNRKSTPSLPIIFFHQIFRYVIGLVIFKETKGGSDCSAGI